MSGVFGLIDSTRATDVAAWAADIGARLCHRPWHVAEHWVDSAQGVAVGRHGIGIFNRAPQPVWNAERTLALVMAGEFYNPRPPGAENDEQAALALYEQHGPEFARQLNGPFVIAVWDAPRQRLVITNDRFGLYPLYYSHRAGRLAFAPEVKGVLGAPGVTRALDMTALAQYLRFQHLLGERTFFEDVLMFPLASVLTYHLPTDTLRITPYWSWGDIPHRPTITFNEAVEETGRLLRATVQRLSGDAYRPGVYLSGGLDSRTIVGLSTRRPIASVTYGARDCRDVQYARRIARVAGSDHHWFDLPDGHWVEEQADFHLTLTEGFHSWIHAHGLSTLPHVRAFMDVNLTGWDGGTVMGHMDSVEPLQTAPVSEAALTTRLFELFNQQYTWPSLTEAEEALLYAPALGARLRGVAFDSFREELQPYLGYRRDVRGEFFYLRNHCGRLTQNFITFGRSHFEARFPFTDYALLDFLYSLPADLRGHRRLYRAVIQRETPQLAYIPYDHDDLWPTTRPLLRAAHTLGVRLRQRFNRHIAPLFPAYATLYADYENYLRRELRPWTEAILFDSRTVARGFFDPAYVRTLFDRHCSGREPWTIGKLAPLMTYEMMLRRFCD